MDEPLLVTVITPAYNRASYLDETILSILNQDYPNIEYIVLDDGSKDNTREVLSKYTGRITWESHTNIGETRTVNKGFGMAKGEIICIVNSDDPLLPGAVRTAVEFMEDRPELLVAYPNWLKIDPQSQPLEEVYLPEYDYLYMLYHHHCIVGPGAFIRRKALSFASGRDPDFRYVADYEYWLRLGLFGPFARIPQVLATFRSHPDSASIAAVGKRMADEHIRLINKIYNLPNLTPEVKAGRRLAYSWAHFVAMEMCGNAYWEGYKHQVMSYLYYPKNVQDAYWQSMTTVHPLLPTRQALYCFIQNHAVTRGLWSMIRPVRDWVKNR